MFSYYLMLGLRSLRRNPILTSLIVLTLAIGVAASVSTLTILHMMSSDPIPHKSQNLLVPVLDNAPLDGYIPGQRPEQQQMSYRDSLNLMGLHLGQRRTAVYGIAANVEAPKRDLGLISLLGLATTNDFFSMFEVPFKYGSPWNTADDKNMAKVAVLSQRASENLFGEDNPVGQHLRLLNDDYQIIGVLAAWNPLPRYTHLINGNGGEFVGEDEIFIPFRTAISNKISPQGRLNCNSDLGPGYQGLLDSECTWIQFWFEVDSAAAKNQLRDQINAYTAEQRKLGRFPRQNKNELLNVMEWMEYLGVVSNDSKLSTWLAFGFLALCLVNTIGLLLAKFSSRATEVGVRRALGASKAQVFQQFLMETAVLGLVGGVLGLVLSFVGLWLISLQSEQLAAVAHMDISMLTITFILAVSASVLAGLLPTWRACQVTPAIQLKSQ